ncbi:MAG: DUF349 domain-containing protein [Bacteroidetes bacterium]|nr:MAG: DUF349 domain-containing protein [Bacteroidota bacterium]
MEENKLIEELKGLSQQEDILSVSREVNELKTRFEDYILEEERKQQIASMEAQEKGEEIELIDLKPLKDEFYEIYNDFREKRKQLKAQKDAEETEHLKQKKALIAKLQEIILHEENIGSAFNAYKEIHDKWKTIGDIPREKRDEIQKEYSKLLEQFFYNIKIYKELKDHDLKRNTQLKTEIIQQLEELKNVSSIKELESALKSLQNDWDEIGPVINEEWETLKNKYWENVRSLYEKIHQFYDERRNTLQENISKKKELISKTEQHVAESIALSTVKEWEKATSTLLHLQETWKSVGFGPKKENEEVWQEFRALCDRFFEAKKAFFATVHEQYSDIAEAKKQLIQKAHELKDSTDWKETANQLIQLQKQWKKTGHAGQKLEQKLWNEFRSACDAFFNARQKYFEDQDKELESNLKVKETIIEEISAYQPKENIKETLADLKQFASRFNDAGKVPMKEKNTIYDRFKSALDKHYAKIKLEGSEKDKIMFEAKLETMQSSPDSARLMSRERADIRQQIDKLNAEIIQFENNLGFFARSKGADALRKEVETKIKANQDKIQALRNRLKLIPYE